MANRKKRAWSAFFAHKALLCHKQGNLKKRIQLLDSLVSRSLFWCSGTWVLTRKECESLRGLQSKMERKMLRQKKEPEDTAGVFVHRANKRLRLFSSEHGRLSWSVRYHKSVFSLAGHFARFPQYDVDRLTHCVLRYTDWAYIQQIAVQNSGRQLHCRRLRTWRWERQMYKYFPSSPSAWLEAAQDKKLWASSLDSMALWRDTHR